MRKKILFFCLAWFMTAQAAEQISIAQFIDYADPSTTYRLTGEVQSIINTTYGNFTLSDETGSIFIYGLLNANGQNKQFASMGIVEGDTLTLEGVYYYYTNPSTGESKPEISSAQYISHVHPGSSPVTPDPTKTEVDFAADFAGGWSAWVGKTLTFTNDFYVYNTSGMQVAYMRLRSPEEYGDDNTAAYANAEAHNNWASCTLSGVYLKSGARPGTIIRNLQATVTAANQLQAVSSPTIIYNELPTERPDLGGNVVICGTNIENFFVTLGGYAGASNQTQLDIQKQKISSALCHIDADIYAICEMEQGPLAVTEMVRLLNELAGSNVYSWINAGFETADAIMVCFIYRNDKVMPYGSYLTPYNYGTYYYREGIQCFEHIATGERFNVSINHFKAKSGGYNSDGTRQTNMSTLISKLSIASNNDSDILVLGDLNAYTNEESNLLLSRDQGYTDLLMKYAAQDYSYVYQNLVGYLDHAYCSPSMESQVTKAVPYHLNADTQTSYKYTNGNTSIYRYSDHDPILVGLQLGPKDTSALDEVQTPDNVQKQIRHGQFIIIRGDQVYTITGQRL